MNIDGLDFEGVGRMDDGRDIGGGGVQWRHVGALVTATRFALFNVMTTLDVPQIWPCSRRLTQRYLVDANLNI
jgi:hypothetical protein